MPEGAGVSLSVGRILDPMKVLLQMAQACHFYTVVVGREWNTAISC